MLRDETLDWYRASNKGGWRLIVIQLNNSVPVVCFAVDMIFNKLLFRYRHVLNVLFVSIVYAGICLFRIVLLPYRTSEIQFPGMDLMTLEGVEGLLLGFVGLSVFFLLMTTITFIRYRALKHYYEGEISRGSLKHTYSKSIEEEDDRPPLELPLLHDRSTIPRDTAVSKQS